MRFDRLRARGIGPFHDEIDINFESISGLLVAVTGPNGTGKSTCLELLAGALHRDCPTRGPLASLATARDSFVEVGCTNGASRTIKHTLDCVSGKGESLVLDSSGKPVLTSTKVSEFDRWAAKHLPTPEVFYASSFSAQGSGGFVEMTVGDRKKVVNRALGIEHLEVLAKRARERAQEVRAAITTLEARIADERSRASDPAAVRAEVATLTEQLADLESAAALAKAHLDQVTATEQVARLARQDVEAHVARRNEIVARLQVATTRRADVEQRLKNNQGVIARASEIRAAQERAKALDELVTLHGASVTKARAELVAAEHAAASAKQAIADVSRRVDAAIARADRARARLADKAQVEAAAAALEGLREAVQILDGDIARIAVEIAEAQDFVLNAATTRIVGLRGGLERIAAPGSEAEGLPELATATLATDDEAAAKVVSSPAVIEGMRKRSADLLRDLVAKRKDLQSTERIAARQPEIANAEIEEAEAEAEAQRLRDELASLVGPEAHLADVSRLTAEVQSHERARDGAVSERTALQPLLKLVDPLTQAEARVAELQPLAASLGEEVDALTQELARLGDLPEDVTLPDLAGARAKLEEAQRAVSGQQAAIAVRQAHLTEAEAAAKRIAGLLAERNVLDEDVADWTRIADELGKDGLQGLIIDAAGPEITAITNQLLHEAFGSRFTVRFDTVRRSSDGKKDVEDFEISVLDTKEGREGPISSFSGGEKVVLGEAVSLALVTIGCRRTGTRGATLVRDESGAALDAENGRRYITMLRRAAALIDASRVLFVTHTAELAELADARIEIRDGKVSVTS